MKSEVGRRWEREERLRASLLLLVFRLGFLWWRRLLCSLCKVSPCGLDLVSDVIKTRLSGLEARTRTRTQQCQYEYVRKFNDYLNFYINIKRLLTFPYKLIHE